MSSYIRRYNARLTGNSNVDVGRNGARTLNDEQMHELATVFEAMNLNSRFYRKARPLGVACGRVRTRGRGRRVLLGIRKKQNSSGNSSSDIFRKSKISKLQKEKSVSGITASYATAEKLLQDGKVHVLVNADSQPTDFTALKNKSVHSTTSDIKTVFPVFSSACVEMSKTEKESLAISENPKAVPSTNPKATPVEVNLITSQGVSDLPPPPPHISTSKESSSKTSVDGGFPEGRRNQRSVKTNFNFDVYLNKRVITKIVGDRWVEGTLRGYDSFTNVVLEDSVEIRRNGDRVDIGYTVIRGRTIVMVEEAVAGIIQARRRYFYCEKIPVPTIQLVEKAECPL